MSGFSKEYARKRGAGGMKMDEMRISPLNSRVPSISSQGLRTSYMQNYVCFCVGLHMFVESVHSFQQILKGLRYQYRLEAISHFTDEET